jgi:hypothetical protein
LAYSISQEIQKYVISFKSHHDLHWNVSINVTTEYNLLIQNSLARAEIQLIEKGTTRCLEIFSTKSRVGGFNLVELKRVTMCTQNNGVLLLLLSLLLLLLLLLPPQPQLLLLLLILLSSARKQIKKRIRTTEFACYKRICRGSLWSSCLTIEPWVQIFVRPCLKERRPSGTVNNHKAMKRNQ